MGDRETCSCLFTSWEAASDATTYRLEIPLHRGPKQTEAAPQLHKSSLQDCISNQSSPLWPVLHFQINPQWPFSGWFPACSCCGSIANNNRGETWAPEIPWITLRRAHCLSPPIFTKSPSTAPAAEFTGAQHVHGWKLGADHRAHSDRYKVLNLDGSAVAHDKRAGGWGGGMSERLAVST